MLTSGQGSGISPLSFRMSTPLFPLVIPSHKPNGRALTTSPQVFGLFFMSAKRLLVNTLWWNQHTAPYRRERNGRFKWEPDEVNDLRTRINLNITMLDSFPSSFTRDNVTRLVKRMEKDEAWHILDWLDGIDYGSQQSNFARSCQLNTGKWLLMSNQYQSWIRMPGQTLFCPGISGAGKTILSSIVVDDLLDRSGREPSVEICYILQLSAP